MTKELSPSTYSNPVSGNLYTAKVSRFSWIIDALLHNVALLFMLAGLSQLSIKLSVLRLHYLENCNLIKD